MRYFIITGMGRTGTHWLAQMLSQHPDVYCPHEPFSFWSWPAAFDKWKKVGEGKAFVGMSNSYARCFIPEIENAIHPDWVFLWRHPFDLLQSIVSRKEGIKNIDNFLRSLAMDVFGQLECVLHQADRMNIKLQHFYFDEYTTTPGFSTVTDYLGIPWETWPEPVEPTNVSSAERRARTNHLEWKSNTRSYIVDVVVQLPKVRAVYDRFIDAWMI